MHCLNNIPVVCLCLHVGNLSYWRSLALAGGWWLETGDGWQREGLSALNGPLLWFSRLRSNKRKGSFSGTEFRFNSVFRPLMKFSLLSYPSLKKKKSCRFLQTELEVREWSSFFLIAFPGQSLSLLPEHLQLPSSIILYTQHPFPPTVCGLLGHFSFFDNFIFLSFSLSLFPFFLPLSLLHTYAHTRWWFHYLYRWSFQYPRVIFLTSFPPIIMSFPLFQHPLQVLNPPDLTMTNPRTPLSDNNLSSQITPTRASTPSNSTPDCSLRSSRPYSNQELCWDSG